MPGDGDSSSGVFAGAEDIPDLPDSNLLLCPFSEFKVVMIFISV